jgi:hypothetical protein
MSFTATSCAGFRFAAPQLAHYVRLFFVAHAFAISHLRRLRNCEFPFWLVQSHVMLWPFDQRPKNGASTMEWTTPKHEEIDMNCEISSYANAEL